MLSRRRTKIYTDHKNLTKDALGLTSDLTLYQWRLLLEEYGTKIMHIKGIHSTVAYAIAQLDFGPVKDNKVNWMTFTKCWHHYTMHDRSGNDT